MSLPGITSPAGALAKSATSEQSGRVKKRRGIHRELSFWSFVIPMLLGLLVFVYAPIIWGFLLSFFEARASVVPTRFVGLQNYIDMLQDPAFIQALVTFTLFAVFIVPTTFFIALGIALLINSVRFGQGFFRSVFFIPTACSYVVASLVWKMSIFNGLPYGLANMLRGLFNQDSIDWIGTAHPPYYWLVLVTVRLWLQLGFYMIIFLAGLKDIPQELYEAAQVDGARGGWDTFRFITFPLLRNTSVAVLLLNLIAAFQAFDEFYNIMGGFVGSSGNAILARSPLVYLYGVAFGNQNFGLGSAGAIILTIVILVFTLVQSKVFGFGKAN